MAHAIASTQINALFKKKAPTPPPAPAKKGFSLPSFPGSKKAAAPPPKSKESSGFKLPSFGTKASPAPTKKAAAPKKAGFSLPSLPGKKAPATKKGGFGTKNGGKAKVRRSANDGPLGLFQGNFGANRTLWNGFASNPEAPAYLDGTLPGDAGFDPFGLSKPVEYLQFDLDSLDQNSAISPSGNVIGKLKRVDNKSGEQTLVNGVELTETFDIVRFRECELQHSRWAMLGLVGCVIGESSTGVSWADAGKVAVEQPSYLGFPINIPLSTIVAIEVLAMAFVEYNRGKELDSDKRLYPGGAFDPLKFAGEGTSEEGVFKLRTAELKHGRLAMIGMLGIGAQAGKNGEGALEALFSLFPAGEAAEVAEVVAAL